MRSFCLTKNRQFSIIRKKVWEKDFMEFVIEHLEKHFEKKQVLRDVSFTFESGKIYGLLGETEPEKLLCLTV